MNDFFRNIAPTFLSWKDNFNDTLELQMLRFNSRSKVYNVFVAKFSIASCLFFVFLLLCHFLFLSSHYLINKIVL
jgi:hypothetical protein